MRADQAGQIAQRKLARVQLDDVLERCLVKQDS
jgi:hypothetical protein